MFKLTKYEFRKNIGVIVTIIAALFGVELFFLIGNVRDAAFAMVGGFFVLIFGGLAAYFTVFFLGISSYQKELSSKGSYLAFMTPNSSLKIICSKLLFTFSVGVIFLVIIAGFLSIDVEILGRKFDDEVSLIKLFISIANMSGYNVLEIAYALVALALDFLIVFFMVVSVAYFSITLSLNLYPNFSSLSSSFTLSPNSFNLLYKSAQ